MNWAGVIYKEGNGVPINIDRAEAYYVACLNAAYDSGAKSYCAANLANLYRERYNRPYDGTLSFALYLFAAEIGDAPNAAEGIETMGEFLRAVGRAEARAFLQTLRDGGLMELPQIRDVRPEPWTWEE